MKNYELLNYLGIKTKDNKSYMAYGRSFKLYFDKEIWMVSLNTENVDTKSKKKYYSYLSRDNSQIIEECVTGENLKHSKDRIVFKKIAKDKGYIFEYIGIFTLKRDYKKSRVWTRIEGTEKNGQWVISKKEENYEN